MSFMYKLFMNSLYGRFSINPKSTKNDIGGIDLYHYMMKQDSRIDGDILVRAAAITACARIYMYPYTSREDCYYTDTDSVVLGNPLPEAVVSSSELGKFKLEEKISKGFFLAPKSYYCYTVENEVIK
ncbi:DNA polymerase [Bienertia sinuspersici]